MLRLREAAQEVVLKPGSTSARVALATALEQTKVEQAEHVWEAAAYVAAAKGDFFNSLAICRLHMAGERQRHFLENILEFYSPNRGGPKFKPPRLPPRSVRIPDDPFQLVDVAIKTGMDITENKLTHQLEIPEIPIFSSLPKELLLVLLQNMVPIPLQPNDVLIEQGTRGQSCFLLTHGVLSVLQMRPNGEPIQLAKLQGATIIGETSLLSTVSRRATVVSETLGMVWAIDVELLGHLGQMHKTLIPQIRTLIRLRLISNLMNSSDLFAFFGEQERMEVLEHFTMHTIKTGGEVVAQGEISSGILIVMHGEAFIHKKLNDGSFAQVAKLNEGDLFGIRSFLLNKPSRTTIWMPEGGLVLRLSMESYQRVRRNHPIFDKKLREGKYKD